MPELFSVIPEQAEGKTPISFKSPLHHSRTFNCAVVTRYVERTTNRDNLTFTQKLLAIRVQVEDIDVTIDAKDIPEYVTVVDCLDPLAMPLIRDLIDKSYQETGKPPLSGIQFGDVMQHPTDLDVTFIGYNLWTTLGAVDTSKVIRKRKPVTA